MANAWFTQRRPRPRPRDRALRPARRAATRRHREGRDALHLERSRSSGPAKGIGKVLEFAGDGVVAMPLDERATLANMAVEAGGFTGIIEADEVVVDYLVRMRGLTARRGARAHRAQRSRTPHTSRTSRSISPTCPPMVATPGDPRNGVPLAELGADVRDRHRVRRQLHRRQEERHGHVRLGPVARARAGHARRRRRRVLHPVRLAAHPPLRRGEGLRRRLRGGRRAA